MSDPKRIAYRYVGPAKYRGVPANDLTQERVDALPLKLQRALTQEGSPYKKVDSGKAEDKSDKGTGKKGEVN